MTEKCSLHQVLDQIGGKWKPLIIFNLKQNQTLRFGELRKTISGISEKVLTSQLRELQGDGFVNRKSYPEIPPKVEYTLTEKGQTIFPILESLAIWAEKNLSK